ncbi:MAG: polysaccharide biosynthesis protein [Phycisphaeraceae bacterium]
MQGAAPTTPDRPRSPLRVILVGTSSSVRQLDHALAGLDLPPHVLGCVLPAADAGPPRSGRGPGRVPAQSAGARSRKERDTCPVLGRWVDAATLATAHEVDQVLVSVPAVMADATRQLTAELDDAGVTWRALPTLDDQLVTPPAGQASGVVDPASLLDRAPHALDEAAIARCIATACVLITGAGGSIGSELARIAARFKPARLVLVERSENALFQIDGELAASHPHLHRRAVLHDVTHRAGTFELIAEHRPHIILHAAAHKHVPMMEDHPAQAVENNFYGSRAIADAADHHGVDRLVMISTDKAVNPSSVMGATKRLAELYIQDLAQRSATVFSMVRFGNVLGSACSVLPIWAQQLARGGPLTVTHPQMSRYFMTIPEAAGLVLQAGALSEGGEIFLLDMGEPVRIVDLAERFIRAHRLEPGIDVDVVFTGIRPGEKLHERLAYDGEDMARTSHASIHIWRPATPVIDVPPALDVTPATVVPRRARQAGADVAGRVRPAGRHAPSPAPARVPAPRVASDEIAAAVAMFDRLRGGRGDPAYPWHGVDRDAIVAALRRAIPEMAGPRAAFIAGSVSAKAG